MASSLQILLILMGALIKVINTLPTENPCHSDCIPFYCNGPYPIHCTKCPGNQLANIYGCVCREFYFTQPSDTTPCTFFKERCLEINPVTGDCLKCQTVRDSLVSGSCVRVSNNYWFQAPGSTGWDYDNSMGHIDQDLYFSDYYSNNCLTLDSNWKCADCISSK